MKKIGSAFNAISIEELSCSAKFVRIAKAILKAEMRACQDTNGYWGHGKGGTLEDAVPTFVTKICNFFQLHKMNAPLISDPKNAAQCCCLRNSSLTPNSCGTKFYIIAFDISYLEPLNEEGKASDGHMCLHVGKLLTY